MTSVAVNLDALKHKVRKLKQLEINLRFHGIKQPDKYLVWDYFFDLNGTNTGKAKYSLCMLAAMTHEEYKNAVNEYFAFVYYELYKQNGVLNIRGNYDPDILSSLNLPLNASESDIKKRFRELAKLYHPDAGGDAALFIELMDKYKRLIG